VKIDEAVRILSPLSPLFGLLLACTDAEDAGEEPAPLAEPLAEGDVRAGEIRSPRELLAGGRADGRVGDFKLYNDRVAFVIRGARRTTGWAGMGGHIADVARALPDGGWSDDALQEIVPIVGFVRVLAATSVEVVADGHDGRAAVVRALGRDHGLGFFDYLAPTDGAGLEVETDYRLEPGATAVEVITRYRQRDAQEVSFEVGDVVILGSDLTPFARGLGLVADDFAGPPTSLLGGFSPDVSIGLFSADPDASARVTMSIANPLPFQPQRPLTVPAGGAATYRRFVVVGDGTIDSIRRVENRLMGVTEATLSGRITLPVSADPGEVVVLAAPAKPDLSTYDDLRHRASAQTHPDADGRWSLTLPPGEYRFGVAASNHTRPEPQTVSHGTTDTSAPEIILAPSGHLRLRATFENADGSARAAEACKLTIMSGHGAPRTARSVERLFLATCDATTTLPPGDYTGWISRGPEYDLDSMDFTIAAGATVEVGAKLVRVLDTAGWVAADFHSHSELSFDSTHQLLDKVTQQAAEGLELVAASDHDVIADWAPWAETAGVAGQTRFIMGIEVTPPTWHVNAFPVVPPEGPGHYWDVEYVDYDAAGVMRERTPAPRVFGRLRELRAGIVQINHPRLLGYLAHVGYNRRVGVSSADPAQWSADFDAIEVFNGATGSVRKPNLLDWYALLNEGLRVTATGNSDTHYPNYHPGFPRNFVAVGDDAPASFSVDEAMASVKRGAVVVAGGAMIHFSLSGAGLGDTLVPAGAGVTARIRVESPSWAEVATVELVENGETTRAWQVDPATRRGAVVFEEELELTPAADSWYLVLAEDTTADLAPASPGDHTLSFTNPVFVDLDGDGWDPPGL